MTAWPRYRALLGGIGLAAAAGASMAAATEIATTPIITASSVSAKPNIMFILDNSGSMAWSFMPDVLGNTIYGATDVPYSDAFGYWSVQCNGVAYDPNQVYVPPVDSTGTAYPAATFTAAPSDGYVSLSARTNLNNSYYYVYNARGRQAAMGWTYNSAGVDKTTTFYQECMSSIAMNAAPGSTVFDRKTVTSTSSEAQNYANWYAYYRKRYLTMRTSVGRAFSALDSNYRVGFSIITDTAVQSGSNYFVDAADFTAAQKTSFFNSLYSSPASGSTPLRAALSKIGRYFANKASGQRSDPMQYACQRNYAILSTDGYWNSDTSSQLDGYTAVGQQDGTEARPMNDGATSTSTVTKTWTQYQWVVSAGSRLNGCTGSTYATRITPQTRNETIQTKAGAVQSDTYSAWANGSATTSCSASSPVSNGTYTSTSNTTYTSTTTGLVTATSAPVITTSGGSADTLADVAEYYYKTDLRSTALGNCTGALGTDVCSDILSPNGLDVASWQHMTTYTIGLGVSGTLPYDRNYLTQTTGSYARITAGTLDWPTPTLSGGAANVDDLWHAAVNGRGRYFAASNSNLLSQAITGALSDAKSVVGSAAGAATNSMQPVSGASNQAYVASYKTYAWTGDLKAYPLDAATGNIDMGTVSWSAQSQLDALGASARKIYYRKPTTGALTEFSYANLGTDGLSGNFDGLCSKTSIAAQCASLTAAQLTLANSGSNLVSWLRGDNSYEAETNPVNPLYREREHLLGDIVNGSPVYVGKPALLYADAGYSKYVSDKALRKPVMYTASNDGMLHAFSAGPSDGGTELWAYIPTLVMSKLYRLADTAYSTNHQYFVDGTPVVNDVYIGGTWKTILVGGLNDGGAGYYALDISDPANPAVLWEFSDANLGLSYGNPVITKRADGTWVVAVASGYNNADGKGHLFVLDAATGTKLLDLATTSGSPVSPSGLAKISAYADSETDNTALRFYGGDLNGNLWRFDTDNRIPPSGNEATLLATFQVPATSSQPATPQPITTAPQPAQITKGANKYPVVVVATGRFLSSNDIPDTTQQSIYVVKDTLAATGLGDVRASAALVSQAVSVSGNTSTITKNSVDWTSNFGWKVDLPTSRERVFIDPVVQFNTVVVASGVPGTTVCTPSGGSSWLYQLDIGSGGTVAGDGSGSQMVGSFITVGLSWLRLGTGTSSGTNKIVITGSDGNTRTLAAPGTPAGGTTARRTSWRELN